MKINKLNYENYVIDYIEGTLSRELKKDFDLFLIKNEEVYEEIKDYISAPVFEESNEIFTPKKAIRKSDKLSPYILLAIIPLLLLGGYFLKPSKTETKIEVIKEKPIEVINQFAQEKNIEVKQEIKAEPNLNLKKETIKLPIQKQAEKKTKQKRTPQSNEVQYAENSDKQDAIYQRIEPIMIIQKTEAEVEAPKFLNNIASIDALPLNTFKIKSELNVVDRPIAGLNTKENKLNSILSKKSSWLEMITPASFNDVDFKESLAIESNININTSRKILNAFIPESLVK